VLQRYRAGRGPFWTLMSQVLTSACNFLTSVIIIRSIGLVEFGRFSVCFLIIMLTRKFLITSFLTPMSSIYPTIERGRLPSYRFFLYCYAGGFALVTGAILFALSVPLGSVLNAPWLPPYALAMVCANGLANITDFSRRLLLDEQRPERSFAIDVSRFGLQLVLLGWFAFAARDRFTAETAVWVLACSSFVGFVVSIFLTNRIRLGWAGFAEFWSRHRHFTGWNTVSTVLDIVQNSVPLFIATAILGEAALGTVRAIQQLANTLSLPLNVSLQVIPGMASRRYVERGLASMRRFLRKSTLLGFAAVLLIALVVMAVSSFVINGALKIDDPQALPIFVAYMAVNAASLFRLPVVVVSNVLGRPRLLTLPSAVGAVVGAGGTWLLIRHVGPVVVPLLTTTGIVLSTALVRINIARSEQTVPA
jgi:O-antigen/teichoic acid export membrane protein